MAGIQDLLNDAIATVNASGSGIMQLADSISGTAQAVQTGGQLNAQNIIGAGEAAAESARQVASANFAQRKTLEYAQQVLGIDPDVADNELARSTAQLTEARQKQIATTQRYEQLNSVSLFDDPLAYIFNQIELPQAEAAMQVATTQHAQAKESIGARLDIANKVRNTVVANTADRLQSAELLKAQGELLISQANARQAEMQASGQAAGLMMQRAGLLDRINDNKVRVVSMQLQAAQTEASRATAAAQREQANIAKQQWNALQEERLAVMLEKKEARAVLDGKVKSFGEFIGIPGLTVAQVDQLGPKGKLLLQAASGNQIGADLADTAATLELLPVGAKLSPGPQLMMSRLAPQARAAADREEAAAVAANTKIAAKDKPAVGWQALQSSLQNAAMGTVATDGRLSDPKYDTNFTPYRVNHRVLLDEVAAGKQPQLAGNVMLEAVKTVATTATPVAGDNLAVSDEQRALKAVAKLVADRKILAKDAALQVKTYMQAGVNRNMELFQYTVLGLAPQTGYRYKIKGTYDAGTGSIEMDLLNPLSVETGLKKLAVESSPLSSLGYTLQTTVPAIGIAEGVRKMLPSSKP